MLPSKEEIKDAITTPDCLKLTEIEGFSPIPGILGPLQYPGGFSIVFPFTNGKSQKAVRVWHREIPLIKDRLQVLSSYLDSIEKPRCFINYHYYSGALKCKGEALDVVIMDWVEGKTLKDYINQIICNRNALDIRDAFVHLAKSFFLMFQKLHELSICHGDLQHGNIIISPNDEPILIDYDSVYIPQMGDRISQVTIGLSGYQHPGRKYSKYSSLSDDYFSELIIIGSLIILSERPDIWNSFHLNEDDYSLVFTQNDYSDFLQSKIVKALKDSSTETQFILLKIKEALSAALSQLKPIEDLLSDIEPFKSLVSKSLYCINCASKFEDDDIYCINCGTKRI